ncbi:hypothetical protein GTY65_01610 [Streptomyces sp. SID8379]|uniref:hypothetical protein n=1 Tax=unclassified Streptomyces TaxID=2593676 RepID=UPI00035DE80F|nr:MULTISPECIES: hypothetical protein [unclassified Streptomyces]MYW62781.1 hypothetical protein [Streptomyces sp. SID8379]
MSVQSNSTAARLLESVDPLPYPRRMREIGRRARELAGTGELAPVVAELTAQGPHERSVCAVLACAGGDAAWAAAHLADPDPFVRGHARRTAGVSDAAYEAALDDAPEAVRRELLRAIVLQERTALADRLVATVRADWGDAEAARLLAGCSPEVVTRVLPDVFHAVRGWKVLAGRHAGAVLDIAARRLAEVPEAARDGWWQHYGPVLARIAPDAPLRVLDLLDACPPRHFPWPLRPALGALAAADPARVLRMMTGPWRGRLHGRGTLTPAVLRAVARSGAPELAAYAAVAADRPHDLAALLRAQAPADRPATYEAATAGRGAAHDGVDTDVLDALPRFYVADVARPAARAARERADSWDTVLTAESYLPPDEVREALDAATRRPVAADRALAWPLHVRNAARTADPGQVTLVTEELARRLRNEQDPVRGAVLQSLAGDVHPALWRAEALPHLGRLVTDALQARDCSYGTRGALTGLAVGILRHQAVGQDRDLVGWALDVVVATHGHTGAVYLGDLERTLRRGRERDVYEALRPGIDAEGKRNDFRLLLSLARSLGSRAAGVPELQAELRGAIERGDDSSAWDAIDRWLEPSATRDERVAEVLDLVPSAIDLPSVARAVAYRRTDLLDRFLDGPPPYGRFLTDKGPWAFPAESYGRAVRGWLPRQQQAYLRQLKRIAEDADLDLARRTAAIRSAADVPDGGRESVRRWAGSEDVTLAEAALAALGRTPDDLPLLLGHAGDDRARVAVYAASRASRHARPSALAPLLDELLTGPGKKVTSRKEAARLVATRLPARQAAPLLARAYAAPDAHRDVRAACVAFAAYRLLREDAAWEILTDAASERSESVLRRAALRLNVHDVAPGLRERYAALVAGVAETDDDELADTALSALSSWVPWAPQALDALTRLLTDLDRRAPGVWSAAGSTLVAAAGQSPAAADALTGAVRTLMAHGTAPDAGEEQDRPALRRLDNVAGVLADVATLDPALRPLARDLALVLAEDDAFVPQAAQVRLAGLDFSAPGDELRALAGLHDDRPALAARTAGALRDRLRNRLRGERVPGEVLLPAARDLASGGSLAEGLFAWALTCAGGERAGWPDLWRDILRELRAHPCADVRDFSARVSTAP